MREINIYHSKDVCGGASPWKSNQEVTKATLSLANQGTSVAGLTEQEVLDLYAKNKSAIHPQNLYIRTEDPENQNTW